MRKALFGQLPVLGKLLRQKNHDQSEDSMTTKLYWLIASMVGIALLAFAIRTAGADGVLQGQDYPVRRGTRAWRGL